MQDEGHSGTQSLPLKTVTETDDRDPQLYTYPIKSMRPIPLTSVEVTAHGFPYDRRFMLFKVWEEDGKRKIRRMTVTNTTEMVLYHPRIDEAASTITIQHCPPDAESTEISFPCKPDISGLEVVDTALHQSPTKAYNMGDKYNSWFSSKFGYPVMFVYLGPNLRGLRGNLSPKAANDGGKKSWVSPITEMLPSSASDREGITFADVAPYLVVTEESVNDVSARLADGIKMDITKFRPNIVVSGAAGCYDEDFWGGLQIMTSPKKELIKNDTELILTNNCARCASLNIDYETGKPGTGESGKVLKKLMKDRRIDEGNKWAPIFGRYGFLKADGTQTELSALETASQCARGTVKELFLVHIFATRLMSLS